MKRSPTRPLPKAVHGIWQRTQPLLDALGEDGGVPALAAAWSYLAHAREQELAPGCARDALVRIQSEFSRLGFSTLGGRWCEMLVSRLTADIPEQAGGTVIPPRSPEATVMRLRSLLDAEHPVVSLNACFEFLWSLDVTDWRPGAAVDTMRRVQLHIAPVAVP